MSSVSGVLSRAYCMLKPGVKIHAGSNQTCFPGGCFGVKEPECYRKIRSVCECMCRDSVYASVTFTCPCRPVLLHGKGLPGGTLVTSCSPAPNVHTHSSVSHPDSMSVLKALSTHLSSTQQTAFHLVMGCKSKHTRRPHKARILPLARLISLHKSLMKTANQKKVCILICVHMQSGVCLCGS